MRTRILVTSAVLLFLLSGCTQQSDLESNDLMHAVEMGDIRGVRFYMDDADLNQQDDLGRTPVSVALLRGELDIAKLLLEKGADCPEYAGGNVPLLYCMIEWHDMDAVRLMLENGANPNLEYSLPDGRKVTPLIHSLHHNLKGVLELLADYNADPNVECNYVTALDYAASQNDVFSARVLLKHGAKPTPGLVEFARNNPGTALAKLLKEFESKGAGDGN